MAITLRTPHLSLGFTTCPSSRRPGHGREAGLHGTAARCRKAAQTPAHHPAGSSHLGVRWVEAWGQASRRPGYQCRGSFGPPPLFPAICPLLSQCAVPLAPQVDPSVLPSRPRLQAFLLPQRRRPARRGGPSRARSAPSLLPALDLPTPPAQGAQALLLRRSASACTGPDSHWV